MIHHPSFGDIDPELARPIAGPVQDDCGHRIGYIVKGYHENAIIWEAIRRSGWHEEQYDGMPEKYRLEQTTVRCIPEPPGSDSGYAFRYEFSKPGRGAFQATFAWID